ncbi:MAG: dihydropteroate synthase [Actinobacteria bacterium]|nr:dihydropteroate synthase [Actinomycetota bacterium]
MLLRDSVLESAGPIIVGVVNVTPDSFSDGGMFADALGAIEHGVRLVEQGAHVVDVGGESTRPGAAAVGPAEELRRVLPVVAGLASRGVIVSIDTRHAEVARAALESGAALVNDVSGLRDPVMRDVLAEHDVPVVIMHTPVDNPATMQRHAQYDDVVQSVVGFLRERVAFAAAGGVTRVIVDPGIGFGKTTDHNLEILRRLEEVVALGLPVLVGASRKRFVGEITGVDAPGARLAGTLVAHLAALDHGASMLRVHDVAAHVEAVRMWQALRA